MERGRRSGSQASMCGTRSFPTHSVAILSLCTTTNSFALVNLLPYVGFMVKDLMDLESNNEVGYYAGYIASAFILGQVLSGYFWGYVSDHVGRKPVIIAGLFSVMVFSVIFGSSTTFTMAVLSRVLLGLTNGIITTTRVLMREVCGEEHVAVGMTYLGGAMSTSVVLGAGVGGVLADPARHYPGTFSATGLFARYPYLLPNLVGACLACVVLVLVVFCLKEEKDSVESPSEDAIAMPDGAEIPEQRSQAVDMQGSTDRWAYPSTENGVIGASSTSNGYSSSENGVIGARGTSNSLLDAGTPLSDGDDLANESSVCGVDGVLSTPTIVVVLFLGFVVQLISIGFDEAFPLWALSDTDVGGLDWGTKTIGQVWIIAGLFAAVLQLVWLPRIAKEIGMLRLQRAGFLLGVLAFLVFPHANLIAWNKSSLFAVCVVNTAFVNAALAAVDIALTVASTIIAPKQQRGQFNGMFSTASSLGRLVGPIGYGTTFAYSISPSAQEAGFLVDFHLVFYVSAVITAGAAVLSFCVLTSEYLPQPDEVLDSLEGGCGALPDRLTSSTEEDVTDSQLYA